MEKLTLLVDGDVFAFKAAAASERAIHWTEDIITLDANLSEARARFDDSIEDLKDKLKATDVVIALSDVGSGYWRRRVYPAYKSNRKDARKPLALKDLRQYVLEKYDAKLKPMLEGDDVLGILATHPTLIPGRKIIVSIDKDMKTIPGEFYRNSEVGLQEISFIDADYFHMFQTLVGDTTDGYPGCPGVGPVKAEKILCDSLSKGTNEPGVWLMWQAVVKAYDKAGLNEGAALVQARIARILRSSDYDFKAKKPILWNPPASNLTKGN